MNQFRLKSHSKFALPYMALSALFPIISNAEQRSNADQKNILFIAVDDLKPLLGCYGNKLIKTPNIDKLASRGTLFTTAYCQQAVSGPTRASLLTGTTPDRTQIWDLKTLIRDKNVNTITLPQYLRTNGFETIGIGKIFDSRSVDKDLDAVSWSVPFLKFDRYYDEQYGKPALYNYQSPNVKALVAKYEAQGLAEGVEKAKIREYVEGFIKPSTECMDISDRGYNDGAIVEGANVYLSSYKSTKPFFLAVGFIHPHLPFTAPKKYWDLYKREEMPLAEYRQKAKNSPDFAYHNSGELKSYSDIPEVTSFSDIKNTVMDDAKSKELIHGYYAAVSYMDAQVGKLMEALEKLGKAKNTIVVLWGDHGWHLGDHGLWCKHTNFEQATHVPLIIVDPSIAPSRVENPVEFLDIFPTLCDLTNIQKPTTLQGYSLIKLMQNPTKTELEVPYAVSQYPRNPRMGYSIRDNRYRYTVWVDWKDKKTNIENIFAEELYDYQTDPNETDNKIDNIEYQQALQKMKGYFADFVSKRIEK